MAETRMNELAKELLQRSRDHKVPWEEKTRRSGLERGWYQVVFPDGALILTRSEVDLLEIGAGEFEPIYKYRLELLGDTGSIIDSLDAVPTEVIYPTLSEIWDLAESYVRDRGISKALDFLKSR